MKRGSQDTVDGRQTGKWGITRVLLCPSLVRPYLCNKHNVKYHNDPWNNTAETLIHKARTLRIKFDQFI